MFNKPLQHLPSDRHGELKIYKAVINRVRFPVINMTTVFLNLKPQKFFFSNDNSSIMNKFEMKLQ